MEAYHKRVVGVSHRLTEEVYPSILRPPAAAFHLPVRSFARTGEEEGAGELAGGWSSNPSCPEGHILLKTPLHFSQKSVGHFLFPFIYPPSPLFTLFLRVTNRLTAK